MAPTYSNTLPGRERDVPGRRSPMRNANGDIINLQPETFIGTGQLAVPQNIAHLVDQAAEARWKAWTEVKRPIDAKLRRGNVQYFDAEGKKLNWGNPSKSKKAGKIKKKSPTSNEENESENVVAVKQESPADGEVRNDGEVPAAEVLPKAEEVVSERRLETEAAPGESRANSRPWEQYQAPYSTHIINGSIEHYDARGVKVERWW